MRRIFVVMALVLMATLIGCFPNQPGPDGVGVAPVPTRRPTPIPEPIAIEYGAIVHVDGYSFTVNQEKTGLVVMTVGGVRAVVKPSETPYIWGVFYGTKELFRLRLVENDMGGYYYEIIQVDGYTATVTY